MKICCVNITKHNYEKSTASFAAESAVENCENQIWVRERLQTKKSLVHVFISANIVVSLKLLSRGVFEERRVQTNDNLIRQRY